MAKQLTKFCRITKYIEKTDPKLYEILDDLCAVSAFRPRRDHNGITFIWPSKETIEKLSKLRYSDDIEKGIDIVLAHIVHDYLPNAAAWNTKKSDIPNGLSKKINVDKVTGNKILLKDGAELEQDSKFKTFSNRDENQAVYRVVKGSLDPSKHTTSASNEHARKGAPGAAKAKHTAAGGGIRENNAIINQMKNTLIRSTLDISEENGAEASAIAPFAFLVALHKYAASTYDDKQALAVFELIHCGYTPITNTVFTLCGDNDSLRGLVASFRDFLKDESNRALANSIDGKLDGRDEYISMVKKINSSLAQNHKISGGGVREDYFIRLQTVLKDNAKDHGEVIDKITGLDNKDGKLNLFYVALNWARFIEHEYMGNAKYAVDPADENKEAALRNHFNELFDLISDHAHIKAAVTQTEINSLGGLIERLLEQAKEFQKSPYYKFPFNPKAAELNAADEECMKQHFKHASLRQTLANMPAEELANLLDSLTCSSS